MGDDDPVRCPGCNRFVDASTETLDHRDDCRWSGTSFERFRSTVSGEDTAV